MDVSPLTAQKVEKNVEQKLPTACGSVPKPLRPSEEQRRKARDLASQAQQAAIVADNATARDLYYRATQLDPTDPSTAYALARTYDATKDARAVAEYCRFLTLTPEAPEASDVRQRIAALSFELSPPKGPVVAIRTPGAALATGIILPGGGQYYSHRPLLGVVVTALAAGAVYYGLQQQRDTTYVTKTGTDPNGQTYEYQAPVVSASRPNVAVGLGTAAAVTFIAAIESYRHVASANRAATRRATAFIAPLSKGAGVGVRLDFALSSW